jgi:uncharacterized membrane protein YfcA
MALFGRPSERDEARAANWTTWFQRQHPYALASLPLSVFSLTHAGTLWVDEIAGIVLGVMALRQLTRPPAPRDPDAARPKAEGHLLAWGGIFVGTVSLALAILIYFVLPHRR